MIQAKLYPLLAVPGGKREDHDLVRLRKGIAPIVVAAVAFWMGNSALARAEDLKAVYWLIVGFIAVRGAVRVARPGAKA